MDFINALHQAIGLGLEANEVDGKARTEREFTYYGKLTDPAQLEKAQSREDQEQWSIRVDASPERTFAGEIRMRHCRKPDGTEQYILTAKAYKPSDRGKQEAEVEASADLFKLFKQLSNSGMKKTRYCFPREDGLTWEIDAYYDKDGNQVEWCKVDLEVPDNREAPTDFPVDLTEVINGDYTKRTEEERQQVDVLLKKYFLLTNQYPSAQASSESFSEGPDRLYHASGYQTLDLRPGYEHTGVEVKWDNGESNRYLYATTDRESAVDLGIASALEKKFKLDRFQTHGNQIAITTPDAITMSDLEGLNVFIYEIEPKSAHGWVKNNNTSNGMATEWKTGSTVHFRSCQKIDMASWLKTKNVSIKRNL